MSAFSHGIVEAGFESEPHITHRRRLPRPAAIPTGYPLRRGGGRSWPLGALILKVAFPAPRKLRDRAEIESSLDLRGAQAFPRRGAEHV